MARTPHKHYVSLTNKRALPWGTNIADLEAEPLRDDNVAHAGARVLDMRNVLPTTHGYQSYFGTKPLTLPKLPPLTYDVLTHELPDGSIIGIAFTADGMFYSLDGTTWQREFASLVTNDTLGANGGADTLITSAGDALAVTYAAKLPADNAALANITGLTVSQMNMTDSWQGEVAMLGNTFVSTFDVNPSEVRSGATRIGEFQCVAALTASLTSYTELSNLLGQASSAYLMPVTALPPEWQNASKISLVFADPILGHCDKIPYGEFTLQEFGDLLRRLLQPTQQQTILYSARGFPVFSVSSTLNTVVDTRALASVQVTAQTGLDVQYSPNIIDVNSIPSTADTLFIALAGIDRVYDITYIVDGESVGTVPYTHPTLGAGVLIPKPRTSLSLFMFNANTDTPQLSKQLTVYPATLNAAVLTDTRIAVSVIDAQYATSLEAFPAVISLGVTQQTPLSLLFIIDDAYYVEFPMFANYPAYGAIDLRTAPIQPIAQLPYSYFPRDGWGAQYRPARTNYAYKNIPLFLNGARDEFVVIGQSSANASIAAPYPVTITGHGVSLSFPVPATGTRYYAYTVTPEIQRLRDGYNAATPFTYAIVRNELYIHRQQWGFLLKFDNIQRRFIKVTPTFANMQFIQGISAAKGRLIMWDSDNAVYRSAANDPLDFTPSIATQATVHKVDSLLGKIVTIKSLHDGYVIYGTRSIVHAVYTGTSMLFEYKQISARHGIYTPDAVTVAGKALHIAYTNDGLMFFDGNRLTAVSPELSEYLASSRKPIKLKLIQDRYLCIQHASAVPTMLVEHTYTVSPHTLLPALDIPSIPGTLNTYDFPVANAVTRYPWMTDIVTMLPVSYKTDAQGKVTRLYQYPPQTSGVAALGSYYLGRIITEQIARLQLLQLTLWLTDAISYNSVNASGGGTDGSGHTVPRTTYGFIGYGLYNITAKRLDIQRPGLQATVDPYQAYTFGFMMRNGHFVDQYAYAGWGVDVYLGSEWVPTTSIFQLLTQQFYIGPRTGGRLPTGLPGWHPSKQDYLALYPDPAAAHAHSSLLNGVDAGNSPLVLNGQTIIQSQAEIQSALAQAATVLPLQGYNIPALLSNATQYIGATNTISLVPQVYNDTLILDLETRTYGRCNVDVRAMLDYTPLNNLLTGHLTTRTYEQFANAFGAVLADGTLVEFTPDQQDAYVTVGKLSQSESRAHMLRAIDWDVNVGNNLVTLVRGSLDGATLHAASSATARGGLQAALAIHGRWFLATLFGKFHVKGLHVEFARSSQR